MKHSIDALQLLFGEPVKITDKIIYAQPKLESVAEFGEEQYYHILANLTAIPSDMKSVLWDIGIDWMELKDIELFASLSKNIPLEQSQIFFPNVDFTKFQLLKNHDGDTILYNKQDDILIDAFVFKNMQDCLCKSHGIKKKVEKAGNKYTKQILIDEDRQNRFRKQNEEYKSTLYELVSSLVNYHGFKYNYSTVRNLTMFQFMDAVQRCRLIDTTCHLLNGVYSGMIDSSKISSEKLNWMREIKDD